MRVPHHDWGGVAGLVPDYARRLLRVKESSTGPARYAWCRADNGDLIDAEGLRALPDAGKAPWALLKLGSRQWLVSDVARPAAQLLHLTPSPISDQYGGPTPLAATIAGGLVGGGLGYLGGTAADWLMPDYDDPKRRRRVGAVLGGLAGAAPGLALGHLGMTGAPDWPGAAQSWVKPNVIFGGTEDVPRLQKAGVLARPPRPPSPWDCGCHYMPSVDVQEMSGRLGRCPYTQPGLKAAALGLLRAAAGERPSVSPFLLSRVAAGVRGDGPEADGLSKRAGAALGALAAVSGRAADSAQRQGLWAGLLELHVAPVFLG